MRRAALATVLLSSGVSALSALGAVRAPQPTLRVASQVRRAHRHSPALSDGAVADAPEPLPPPRG